MRNVCVAAIQMSCSNDRNANISKAEKMLRKAASQGAQIILIQELFETLYFCQKEIPDYYKYATTVAQNPAIDHFKDIARELDIVIPISFYEKCNNAYFNSIVVIDHRGDVLETYRKSHIPDGPGYEEKYYFSPGDTGFKVWDTKYGVIGIGICWDQWFPETARILALKGAELIFYPTAIGSEPESSEVDSKDHWQRCMIGHSASNLIPVVVSNRVGKEVIEDSEITFYGSSFITDGTGNIVAKADRVEETILLARFDLDTLALQRTEWGVFRDRRPELYHPILTLDGNK